MGGRRSRSRPRRSCCARDVAPPGRCSPGQYPPGCDRTRGGGRVIRERSASVAAPSTTVPDLREAWEKLALRGKSIFGTPTWIETWWQHLGASGDLPQPVADRDERAELVALVPSTRGDTSACGSIGFLGTGGVRPPRPGLPASRTRALAPSSPPVHTDFLGWDLFRRRSDASRFLDWSTVFTIERQDHRVLRGWPRRARRGTSCWQA